ncbi:MAG TPA: c-type cytochrome [Balneolales bacterium]|nr:c-type cytochrome [Balneolales bacterium]
MQNISKYRPILIVGIVILLLLLYNHWSHPRSNEVKEAWKPKNVETDVPAGPKGQLIKYGYELIRHTSKYIGPDVADKKMRFAGNNLSCQNCHLDAGTKPGGASFVGVINRFPQFRKRDNKISSIEDRIEGCMQRSMNGKPLPDSSREMKAIVAYMKWLSEDVPPEYEKKYKGYPGLKIPSRQADTMRGRTLYIQNCAKCHGTDGQGEYNGKNRADGYRYPPLWGKGSFNNGAGMDRILKAASFIKGNMPFGVTIGTQYLTDDECYDIAAYVDSHSRPVKSELSKDFPDRSLKPIDCPYGPFADPFPQKQHKYGPFQPIKKYYASPKH